MEVLSCLKELIMDRSWTVHVCWVRDIIKRGNYEGRATENEYMKISCHDAGQLGTGPRFQGERGTAAWGCSRSECQE